MSAVEIGGILYVKKNQQGALNLVGQQAWAGSVRMYVIGGYRIMGWDFT